MIALDLSALSTSLSQPAMQWLLFPVLVIVSVAALLWSGRIRQQITINTLGFAILLPTVNLTLVGLGLFVLLQNGMTLFPVETLLASL